MVMIFMRIFFVFFGGLVGWILPSLLGMEDTYAKFLWAVMGVSGAILVVGIESVMTKRASALIPPVVIGLIFGLAMAQIFAFVPELFTDKLPVAAGVEEEATKVIRATLFAFFSYVGIATLMHAQPMFRFVTPFLDFIRKQVKTPKPMVLDTSVIIDGRISDICETGLIDNPIVIPKFVLQELQDIADSADKLKRGRGRRGLEVLNRLQRNEYLDIEINDSIVPSVGGVDNKLVRLTNRLDGKLVTNDFNLSKIAQLQGVRVVNVNDLASALKPVVLPGEEIALRIVKEGEEAGQRVGYLDDGTMVVVERAREMVGDEVRVMVTSVFQTSAGKMLFGRPKDD